MKNWDGKLKAITFSIDDGVIQDKKTVEILNKYGLKATFNINSAQLGDIRTFEKNGVMVTRHRMSPSEVVEVYKGHEVGVHTLTHPNLTTLPEDVIIHQVERDRQILSDLFGYEVVGMAYPCGGINNDDRVAQIIKNNTGVKYARTITSTYSFDEQNNLYRFNPTVHYAEENLFEIVEKFLNLKTQKPQLLYIWGHSYEMDDAKTITWGKFEQLCQMLSGKADIFYGTNTEVLLNN